jgi:hypothetical protein
VSSRPPPPSRGIKHRFWCRKSCVTTLAHIFVAWCFIELPLKVWLSVETNITTSVHVGEKINRTSSGKYRSNLYFFSVLIVSLLTDCDRIRIYTCCWCYLPHEWWSRRISESCKLAWYGALKSMLLVVTGELQSSWLSWFILRMELCCPTPPLVPHIYLRKPITQSPTACTVRSDNLTHCHARQAYIMLKGNSDEH